ncbi:ABC transporter permease [Acidobacteriota bacterium]
MKKKNIKIPTLTGWILGRVLPAEDRVNLSGDFTELYDHVGHSEGACYARFWLWAQIFKSLPGFMSGEIYWRLTMFKNYLKIFFRNIIRYKGYSFINLAGLAIGIACCVLIMLYVKDEISYDRFHEKHDRIFRVERKGTFKGQDYHVPVTAHPTGPAFETDFAQVLHAVRLYPRQVVIKNWKNHRFEEQVFFADHALFETFTFPLLKGTAATALKEPNSVVLTEKMSEKYFGSRDTLGQTLTIHWANRSQDLKVTGIMKKIPHNSHFNSDFFVSYTTLPAFIGDQLQNWFNNSVYTYILLQQQSDAKELQAQLPAFIEKHLGKMARKFFSKDMDLSNILQMQLRPVTDIHLYAKLGWEIDPQGNISSIYVFSAIAFFILLIACINFMNLSTARSAGRAKEVGLRKTVGANRGLLIKQFIGESVCLTILAGILALLLVELLLPAYNHFTGKELANTIFSQPLSMLAFLGLLLVVGFISGSYPAFFLSSFQPVIVLKGSTASKADRRSLILRKALVVFQFAISIFLIIGTLIVMNQMNYVKNRNLGFQKEQVLVLRTRDQALASRNDAFKAELLKNSNILHVAASSNIPGARDFSDQGIIREGKSNDDFVVTYNFDIDEDFIPLLGIELAAGRNFSKNFATDREDGYIINETAVKAFGWDSPDEAVGKRLMRPTRIDSGQFHKGTIVGVVKDFHFKSLHQKIEPLLFFMNSNSLNYINIKLKTADISNTMAHIREKWSEFSPAYTFEFFFFDQHFDRLYRSEERMHTLFKLFTLLAIFISCLGLFGLASFTTEQRTKEVGIRKVLGASVINVILHLSKEFIFWVALANLIAWPAAYFFMNKWLQNFAYRTGLGIEVFLLSGLLGLTIALLTVGYQSVKAALANPIKALKYE